MKGKTKGQRLFAVGRLVGCHWCIRKRESMCANARADTCPQTFCKQSTRKSLQTIAKWCREEMGDNVTKNFFSRRTQRRVVLISNLHLLLLLCVLVFFLFFFHISVTALLMEVRLFQAHKFNTRSSGSNLENWSWKVLQMPWHSFGAFQWGWLNYR